MPSTGSMLTGRSSPRPAIIAAGRKAGVEYSFIEDETSDPIGNIPPSIKYLETLGLKP